MDQYAWRTDAASGDVTATDVPNAVRKLVADGEWNLPGSRQETLDLSDGAWLTIFDAGGVPVFRRGCMP